MSERSAASGARDEFEREAVGRRRFFGEWVSFAADNKKWWLTPILAILLLITALVLLTSTGAGPFVYSLF